MGSSTRCNINLTLICLFFLFLESKRPLSSGHFDMAKVNSLLADQPLSSGAEKFKLLFDSFQRQAPPPAEALPPAAGLPLLAGLGALMTNRGSGPPSFASLLANPHLLAGLQNLPMLPVPIAPRDHQEHRIDQLKQVQPPESGVPSTDHLEGTIPAIKPIPRAEPASATVHQKGDTSSLVSTSSEATIGLPALETLLKTYIDAKFQEMEARLMERMAILEENLSSKLNLLLDRL
jgi:hypothetical protein